MELKTEIELQAAEVLGAKYDEACRLLFLNKEIIAPVLKAVVPEYKDCTVDEIIACIDESSIKDDPVDDVSVMAAGLPTEMTSVSEKLIRYDARFRAVNPKLTSQGIRFYLHIDIEVQNDYMPSNPRYPIVKRGIYYAAREISSQLGVLTEKTNYADIQKAYSIWICNESIPKELQNTVTSYALTKQDVIGTTNEPDRDYDLMQVILIRRGNDEGKEEIFDYLTGIFTSNIEKISGYVDVSRNPKVLEGVKAMSGMGQTIATKNYQQGMQQGILQGMQQGMQQGEESMAVLMNRLFSDGRISDAQKAAADPVYRRSLMEYYRLLKN